MKSKNSQRSGQLVSLMVLFIVTSMLVFGNVRIADAATVPPGFTDSLVSAGLSNPTAMALAPDGRIFVCEQGGALRVIKNGVLLPTPFLTVTVDASGERAVDRRAVIARVRVQQTEVAPCVDEAPEMLADALVARREQIGLAPDPEQPEKGFSPFRWSACPGLPFGG